MKVIAIIPARYSSTRFPGKPLVLLQNKPIIQHVYERVSPYVDATFVATDDERIKSAVSDFGGKCVMTSTAHKSGTDRCQEALNKVNVKCDVVLNVQGDEPFISPIQIQQLISCFEDSSTQIATLVKPFSAEMGVDSLFNPNSPKVVINQHHFALYFSRSVIPFLRDVPQKKWLSQHTFYKHIGLYAYRPKILQTISYLTQSPLEMVENLEQLRWLEAGLRIKVGITDIETIGIDTPEDLEKAEKFLRIP